MRKWLPEKIDQSSNRNIMDYRFIIDQSLSGRYYYVLFNSDGIELMKSRLYKTEIECRYEISRMRQLLKNVPVEIESNGELDDRPAK